MISLKQAVEMGFARVCHPCWGGNAYLKIHANEAGDIKRLTAFDYASPKHQLTMNAWPEGGQEMPFDAAGLAEERWLPFMGQPSPFEG